MAAALAMKGIAGGLRDGEGRAEDDRHFSREQ